MTAIWAALAILSLQGAAPIQAPLATGPHTITTEDGLKLWYRVAGPSNGAPVIYLHGGPAEGSQGFARTVGPLLERKLRMVYLDQRGAGHSDKPAQADRYSLAKIVADVDLLRLRLGVDKVALIGHSYGAMVALEYAAAHPEHVSRMVLADVATDFPAAVEAECARLKAEDGVAYARAVAISKPGYPTCIPFEAYSGPAMFGYMTRMLGTKPETMETLAKADDDEHVDLASPSREPLADSMFKYRFTATKALNMPVMVISAGRDRLTMPTAAPAFVRLLPQGRLVTYPSSGHFTFVDAQADFVRDVTSFLR